MAYVAADGPPDLDATHAWAPATGSAPPTINDQGGTDPPTFPWIKIVKPISGWRALPESDDNRAPRTAGPGEITYPGEKLGKTVVYECEIRAKTRQSAMSTMTALLNGYGDTDGEGTMTVTPYASVGGVVWTYEARVLSLVPDVEFGYSPHRAWQWAWGFQLNLRMSDPLFYTGGTGYL